MYPTEDLNLHRILFRQDTGFQIVHYDVDLLPQVVVDILDHGLFQLWPPHFDLPILKIR
jgi:hypothetical protein